MRLFTLLTLVCAIPSVAHAQKRWTPIGSTSSGNPVFIDTKSVKRTGSLVAANVRVVFVTPVVSPTGDWLSGRIDGTFDCAKHTVAAKEQTYYGDKAEKKIVTHKVNPMPGFGPALAGSLAAVALEHLCKTK